MDLWAAFRKTSDHVLDGDGKATNYLVAFCRACEAAHQQYLPDVEACDGDEGALSKLPVVPPAAPVHGRRDKMVPHLRKCPFYQQTGGSCAPS